MKIHLKKGKANFKALIFVCALLVYVAFVLWASPAQAGPFLNIDRVDTESEFPKIKLYVSVRNINNRAITGLDESNLLLYEDGYRVNYVRVKDLSETDDLLYLVFAIDSSKSITQELLNQLKNSAGMILNSSRSSDRIAIYRFNDTVELMNSFTTNREELISNITKVERHGTKTLLYNAIYDSIELLSRVDVTRKAIIVFTDGKDEESSISIDDVISFARETHIPVYFICLKPMERIKLLSRIAKLTGGRLFIPKNGDVSGVYKSILSMIKNQYIIDYQSMLKPDGKEHKLEVRLKYDSIRDREQRDISVKKRLEPAYFPSISEIILISLIIVLVVLLVFVLIFSVKRINRVITTSVPESQIIKPPSFSHAEQDIKKVEDVKPQYEDVSPHEEVERIYAEAWLMERDGEDAGKKIPLLADEVTIGRDENNEIVVKGRHVSPVHAKIKLIKNSFYLFDMASDHGTYLNENKLLRPKLLYDWDEIRIGKRVFIFRGSNIA